MSKVLVTGGSGFVAGHCLLALRAAGHDVRTTLRRLDRAPAVRAVVGDDVAFAAADLTRDEGWEAAVAGCEYVLHVASPFPGGVVENEDDLVAPARDGALRVLKAALHAGVRRVVLTSSFAAIGYGHQRQAKPFDETSWTDLSGADVSAYVKSKTVAERAAWDFARTNALDLVAINPVGIFGPVLGPDISSSVAIVRAMLQGKMPRVPRIHFGVVDVRDVADLHLRAMTAPAAAGERFLAVSGPALSLLDVAAILRRRLGEAAARAPRKDVADWLMRLMALFNKNAREVVPQLGKHRNATSAKAEEQLGWHPRPAADAIVATGESLARLGLV